ncbi:hypothetical protein L2E82_14494 [Cichorium intybus]|uniref:Uncharacterized protein n=1 Tax=Cichorium intybus TaxID=13427 RepID=A0ACB9F0L6_CICIN|nr:hypothetical protein L2E82_14494 [Cichorium intybus]
MDKNASCPPSQQPTPKNHKLRRFYVCDDELPTTASPTASTSSVELSHSSSAHNEPEKQQVQPNATLSRCVEIYRSQKGSLDSDSSQRFPLQQPDTQIDSPNTQIQSISSRKKPSKSLLLHGTLTIWIHEAKDLPNMDMFNRSDPYVTIALANAVIGKTYVIKNTENPTWNQRFDVHVAHHASELHFLVKDSDAVGSQLIGVVGIPVEDIYTGSKIEGSFPLMNTSGKPFRNGSYLKLTMQYTRIERLSYYNNGVEAGPNYSGVPGTYFPLRKGGKVTLYQDAHVPDNSLPCSELDSGIHYVHGTCWIDIFNAIQNAKRLIYITGWSVWHEVKLVRETVNASKYTLGDLLKIKSLEGVKVLLLVWDDPTSRNIMGYQVDGLMATHDEETRRFFKNSSVQVMLCARMAGKKHSWVKKQEVGTIYTHHQKNVIVDADAGNGKRKIISFIGGLDLCNGRYDNPKHPIFKTLDTIHADDFHNPTFTSTNLAGCPREPWHDLHSKIDGPAAYDIMKNFEERWLKGSKVSGTKKSKAMYDEALVKIENMPEFLTVNDEPCLSDKDPEGWHVQIFRSIDSNSVKGFPKDPQEATAKNLGCGKNVRIDMSIHSAYVTAIRGAQNFIYIENQYFIGSSYNWSGYKDLGANNLIPMEIALKIANKIRAHERFAVYIVIPMWPEGVPTGSATQRILFWQHKTMQMMYETIYNALMDVGLEGAESPQDYLNFFCLGNREDSKPKSDLPNDNTPEALSRKNRRFMIYVHSKGMIVDDEYVIIGSANINQRSMEGTRDTEIAMGAYQPHNTWARKHMDPRGQIYGYRMSLWAEHLGKIDENFKHPESIECVRQVRSMAEANWKKFASNDRSEMKGHLLKYPVRVERTGKVRSLEGSEEFPDVGGQIIGSFLGIQENLTI